MSEHAIGFTDVGSGKPGTDSSSFKSPVFQSWSQDFYSRLAQHAERASKNVEGCQCGNCGAPMLVAFAGKRQYIELLNINRKGKKITTVPPPPPPWLSAMQHGLYVPIPEKEGVVAPSLSLLKPPPPLPQHTCTL